jgi:hypothetical protein
VIAHGGRLEQGPAGRAVEVTIEDPRPMSTAVSTWILECPGQSPAWTHYLLTVVHLRDQEGADPAVVNVPHATHEVGVLALDPKPFVLEDPSTWVPLFPVNVSEQLQLPDDAAAVTLAQLCARAVVNGMLPAEPPLAGAKEPWRTSLIQTAAHLRGEEHGR